jgi:hypothetical protein
MEKLIRTKNLLTAIFIAETICATYALLLNKLIPFISIVYFISGLLISGLILFLPEAKQSFSFKENAHHLPTLSFRIVAVIILGVELAHFCDHWIEDAPLNFHDADMLPIMQVMAKRFVVGNLSEVYNIIPEIWNGIRPVYLPAMWMPFSAAIVGNFDPRWITCILLIITFAIFIFVFHPSHQKKVSPFVLGGAFMLFWWTSTAQSNGLIPYTEEGVVIFYYVILTLCLLNGNIWLTSIGTVLCALSRYAFAGWIIPFALLMVYEKKWHALLKWMITGIAIALLFTIIPFGWKPFYTLLSLPDKYIVFAARIWKDAPNVFNTSLGLAKFFGPQNITLLHKLLITLSFIVPFAFAAISVWLRDKKKYHIHNIPLATFKLSLVIFYNFIDVPYVYLFYTSSFVSLIIVGYFVSRYEKNMSV